MKEKLALILTMILVVSMIPATAFADEGLPPKPVLENNEVMVIREDVPLMEALKDPTFDATRSKMSAENAVRSEGAYWDVKGEEPVWVYDNAYHQYKAKPVGTSAQKNASGVILSTYHYTRTYINILGDKRGDSGKVWGEYIVRATGTYCLEDVWTVGVHTVKYGTEA